MDIWYGSVGRNATRLLNIPVDQRGLVHENDAARLMEFKKARQEAFKINLAKGLAKGKVSASNIRGNNRKYGPDKVSDGDRQTYWATDDGARSAWLEIDFGREIEFNRFLAQENIALGQRVKRFSLQIWNGKDYEKIAENTTIGYQRILRLPNVRTSKLKFVIEDARACPAITNIEIYHAPSIIGVNQSIIR